MFGSVKGQKTSVRILSAQLQKGEISHAYLFVGPNGAGKEFLAREFAKLVLCQDLTKKDCPSCKNFDGGAHPDFIFVDGEDGIKIEQVREAMERINLSPNLSKKKVVLFTDGENMGHEAANALLKTFEEPPTDSVIIITATSVESLPKTIVSRAQVIKLNLLPEEDIKKILTSDFPAEKIEEVLMYANGNLGAARKMLEDPAALSAIKLMFNEVEKIIAGDSIIEKFQILERHEKEKNMKEFFEVFSGNVFRSLAEDLSGEEGGLFKNLTPSQKAQVSKKLLKIYEKMAYNVNLRLALEQFILENLQS